MTLAVEPKIVFPGGVRGLRIRWSSPKQAMRSLLPGAGNLRGVMGSSPLLFDQAFCILLRARVKKSG